MESSSIKLLQKDPLGHSFEIDKCIICQKPSIEDLKSTENGRRKIIEAAMIRKDTVLSRVNDTSINQMFKYDMNNECYKSYTLKKTLDALQVSNDIFHLLYLFLQSNLFFWTPAFGGKWPYEFSAVNPLVS